MNNLNKTINEVKSDKLQLTSQLETLKSLLANPGVSSLTPGDNSINRKKKPTFLRT